MSARVIHADCMDALPMLAAEGVLFDAVVCDPPYHLASIVKRFGAANAAPAMVGATGAYARASKGFMGKEWDGGDIAFRPETWAAVLAVMKPGAHLVAFSGTRTYHLMATAIEQAGFEVRDQIKFDFDTQPLADAFFDSLTHGQADALARLMDACEPAQFAWVYGSGFPKSHSIERATGDPAWQGWGSALKPAWEPICLARKPLDPAAPGIRGETGKGTLAANTLAHGCGGLNIDACRIASGDVLQKMSGKAIMAGTSEGWDRPWKSNPDGIARRQAAADAAIEKANALGRWPANLVHDGSPEVLAGFPETDSISKGTRGAGTRNALSDSLNAAVGQAVGFGDSSSAARFFYTAKADASDRLGSKHPTVKPVDLMAWLCRLVTPPGGLVLDPFAGSGTTGMACMREGFRAVLIEREAEYVADIHRRLAHVKGEDAPLFGGGA